MWISSEVDKNEVSNNMQRKIKFRFTKIEK